MLLVSAFFGGREIGIRGERKRLSDEVLAEGCNRRPAGLSR
jgi:hypothetical protein